jgi:hypothetical protein
LLKLSASTLKFPVFNSTFPLASRTIASSDFNVNVLRALIETLSPFNPMSPPTDSIATSP